MNKKIIIGIVITALLLAGVLAALLGRKDQNTSNGTNNSTTQASSSLTQHDACDLLTEAEAKTILGDAATSGTNTPAAESGDLKVSNCSYTNNATVVKDIRVITVTSRSPMTQVGVSSNKDMFGTLRPKGAQKVEGYGEDAYWDPATHQFAILKDNCWIAVVYGGTNPANNTLEDAKLVAEKIVN